MAVIYYPTSAEVLKITGSSGSALTEIHLGVVPGQYFFFTGSTEVTASSSASWAYTASHAITASFALNAGQQGTSLTTGSLYPITSSWAITASFAMNGGGPGGSLSTGSTYPITASWAISASYAPGNPAVSASYATTASQMSGYGMTFYDSTPTARWSIAYDGASDSIDFVYVAT